MGSPDEAAADTQPDIFISYASKDADRVVPIARLLEEAGVSAWRDGDRILGGQYYGEQIVHALTHSRVVLLMCSPDSLASDNVHHEILVNWEYGCRAYVPIWITPPVEIPERFRYCLVGCQWIDAHAEPPDAWLPRLLSALEALGVRPGAGAARESRTPARSASPTTKTRRGIAQTTGGSGRQTRAPQSESGAAGKQAPRAAAKPRGLPRSWPILAAATAGILVAGVVALWAGGVFKGKESPPITARAQTETSSRAQTETSAVPSTKVIPNGFVPLLNGDDLSDWVWNQRAPGGWQMRGGQLRALAPDEDSLLNLSYLLSKRVYNNFHLRLEFLCITAHNALGGIAVRAVPGETARTSNPNVKQNFPFHLTIMIGKVQDRDFTGALAWSPDTRAQTGLLPDRPAELKPAGQWNNMEVEIHGQHLRVIVNGREVLNVMLDQKRPARHPAPGLSRLSGRIGFARRSGQVQFRNVEIKELNSNTR